MYPESCSSRILCRFICNFKFLCFRSEAERTNMEQTGHGDEEEQIKGDDLPCLG